MTSKDISKNLGKSETSTFQKIAIHMTHVALHLYDSMRGEMPTMLWIAWMEKSLTDVKFESTSPNTVVLQTNTIRVEVVAVAIIVAGTMIEIDADLLEEGLAPEVVHQYVVDHAPHVPGHLLDDQLLQQGGLCLQKQEMLRGAEVEADPRDR